jgi:hypothetical protein
MAEWVVASSTVDGIVLSWSGESESDATSDGVVDMLEENPEDDVMKPDTNRDDAQPSTKVELLFLGEW